MEQLTDMIKGLHLKFEAQSNELKEMRETITNDIKSYIDEKIVTLELRQQNLEKITEKQGLRIQQLERTMRLKNVVFFGVEETERDFFELQTKIVDLINGHMNIICHKEHIENIRRSGKKSGKIRPIIVTLSTMGKKIELLKNKNSLSNTSYYIKQDFPPDVIEERKRLQSQLKIEKDKGNIAFIKYNKLIILPKLPQQNERQNRNLSQSPEITSQNEYTTKHNSSRKPQKKNKLEISQYLVRNQSKNSHNKSPTYQSAGTSANSK